MNHLVAKKSPEDSRDWVLESIVNYTGELEPEYSCSKYLGKVLNQGEYPTCAAHSAVCIKQYQEKKDIDYKNSFSTMFVYNNRTNQDSDGMYGRDVMNILYKYGVCKKSMLKYGVMMKPEEIPRECYEHAKNFKIKGYAKINTIKGVKIALKLYGPCYISVPTYNTGIMMWKPQYRGQKSTGGHAMTIIGYNTEGFIIRNSWGKTWGDKGHCTFPYEDFGHQWEIWTLVDDKSIDTMEEEDPEPEQKCKLFCF